MSETFSLLPVQSAQTELKVKLDDLIGQKDALENQIKDVRVQLQEIEGALRVLARYRTGSPQAESMSMDLGSTPRRPTTLKEAALAELPAAGSTANDLGFRIGQKYGMPVNMKTLGNVLLGFKNDGIAHRVGHVWHRIEKQEAPAG